MAAVSFNENNRKRFQQSHNLWGAELNLSMRRSPSTSIHRSDMLLKKQLDVVTENTKSLKEAVEKIEKFHDINPSILQQIALLHRKAQHLKLILDILNKIQLEIKYWRRKLHEATKKHEEEAALIRQRILWLEYRLERIISSNSTIQLSEKFQAPSERMQSSAGIKTPRTTYGGITSRHIPLKKSVYLSSAEQEWTDTRDVHRQPVDEGDRYWMSDHHRFTYTPNMGQLLKENPLSYHNIGLAIPGSYVDKEDLIKHGTITLPWMHDQDPMKGNFDVMRNGLEELLKKIIRISQKIYNAANLSVDLQQQADEVQSHSVTSLKKQSLMPRTPETAATTYGEFPLRRGISLAPSSYSTASKTTKASIYSDWEQCPDVRPKGDIQTLTKTNTTKKYPYCCDRWCNAEPNPNGLAIQPTIVNQRDLRNKTKLKLFVPRKKRHRRHVTRDLITPSSVTSSRSYRRGATAVRFIDNLRSQDGIALSDIQRERINELLNILLTSPRANDRLYAARSLSSLGGTSLDDTLPTLTQALDDENPAVRYEVSKCLVNLGEWHELALAELNSHLDYKKADVCVDVLQHLIDSDYVRTVHMHVNDKPQLQNVIESLKQLSTSTNDEEITFYAALCLGEICGNEENQTASTSTKVLKDAIETTHDWDWHSQALEVLVRRLNEFDETVLRAIITQLKHAVKWQDRLAAALLIAYSGPTKVFQLMDEREAFEMFYCKLWDDPKRDVRLGVSQAFTSLGLRNRLLEDLDNLITNPIPEIRAHAVMAMSAVGIRSDKTLRSLVEMLGLDSSDYVRLQIMRTFHALTITDIRVVRALREREKNDGPLAREASKILASLDVRLTTGISSVVQGRQTKQTDARTATADRTTTALSSWFSSPWGRNNEQATTQHSKRHSRLTHSRSSSELLGTPQYEIVSTAVRSSRSSPRRPRAGTGNTHISSVTSYY